MASKYDGLARIIIQNIGGKENIISVEHCFTRLRFKLKDESKANTDILKSTEGVVNVIQKGGQYQIVIGNHVNQVYEVVVEKAHIKNSTETETETKGEKDKNIFNSFVDTVSGIFLSIIGLLCACGMLKGLLVILKTTGLLTEADGTYVILSAIGDCIFYFFPVFLGYTSAKKFKVNEVIGLAIGASMIYPTIISAMNGEVLDVLFNGTIFESNIFLTFLKIPVILSNYTSTVIPVILAVWLASKVEKFAKKIVPDVIKSFGVPLITLSITVPATFIVIGPVATWLSNIIGIIVQALYNFNPIIFGVFVGGLWQIFVIFGIHQGLIPIVLNSLATLGYDTIFAATATAPFTQVAILLAIILRTKNKKLKTTSISAFFSGIFGITEPAIYGVTLPLKKPFIISCIASAIGGGLAMGLGVKFYNMGGQGIFAFPCYINPNGNAAHDVLMSVIAVLVAMVIAFVLTLMFFKDKSDDKNETVVVNNDKEVNDKKIELGSPIAGTVMPISEVKDEAFASGLMGKGVAIEPAEGKVISPADGVLTSLYPTGHAMGITTNDGTEILIHIGMDTVNLQGKYFDIKAKQGDVVRQGQILVEFDMDGIKNSGYSITTPVIITNSNDYSKFSITEKSTISLAETLITLN